MTQQGKKSATIQRMVTYMCVTGHCIPPRELEVLTEEVELDNGARVRICKEHGAPIACDSIVRRNMEGASPE